MTNETLSALPAGQVISDTIYDDAELYDIMTWGNCESFYFDAAKSCGGPVLELACGTGRMLVPMAGSGLDVIGLDTSTVMLEGAVRRARHSGITVQTEFGDMRDFSFDRRFSLIFVAINSLLHLNRNEDLLACFNSVRRALAPEGRFLFDIFNFAPARPPASPRLASRKPLLRRPLPQ